MSSDSAMTTPFQVAVVMPRVNAGRTAGSPRSPAEGVHLPRLRRPARAAVPPRDDAQRGGRRATLGAVDDLLSVGTGVGDRRRPLLVDGLVAPAGAAEMSFCAAPMSRGGGVPPERAGGLYPRYSGTPAPSAVRARAPPGRVTCGTGSAPNGVPPKAVERRSVVQQREGGNGVHQAAPVLVHVGLADGE